MPPILCPFQVYTETSRRDSGLVSTFTGLFRAPGQGRRSLRLCEVWVVALPWSWASLIEHWPAWVWLSRGRGQAVRVKSRQVPRGLGASGQTGTCWFPQSSREHSHSSAGALGPVTSDGEEWSQFCPEVDLPAWTEGGRAALAGCAFPLGPRLCTSALKHVFERVTFGTTHRYGCVFCS